MNEKLTNKTIHDFHNYAARYEKCEHVRRAKHKKKKDEIGRRLQMKEKGNWGE